MDGSSMVIEKAMLRGEDFREGFLDDVKEGFVGDAVELIG
jgi:hypothetical protein